jgi:magnesium-transporting ATPase (P-type)
LQNWIIKFVVNLTNFAPFTDINRISYNFEQNNLQNKVMISNFTVLTIPQWAIFAGITVMIYGWTEKKKVFGLIGLGILALLGIYAAWILWTGMLVPEELLNQPDPLDETVNIFEPDELPIEGRLLPFYWGLAGNAILASLTMVFEIRRKSYSSIFKIIVGTISIALFFLMIAALRN